MALRVEFLEPREPRLEVPLHFVRRSRRESSAKQIGEFAHDEPSRLPYDGPTMLAETDHMALGVYKVREARSVLLDMCAHRNDDQTERTVAGDECRPVRVPVRSQICGRNPEFAVCEVRAEEHDVCWKRDHLTLCVRYQVSRRQHVNDSRTRRRLKHSGPDSVGYNVLNFVRSLPLRAQFGDSKHAWQKCASALGIQTLRLLAAWHRMLHNRGEAVLSISDLDIPCCVKDVHRCLARDRARTRAERQGDFLLPIHQRLS